ncbi:MAG: DUF1499 domain-containing protein [Rhodothermales bacterium]|nr:DUF1499 domain-containing protein [Rhodothermales bacterium]
MPAESPLAPCGPTPNCYRVSRTFAGPPDTVFAEAEQAVRDLGGLTVGRATVLERNGQRELHATFRVLFFTDDLHLRVDPDGPGSVLHVRSASRTGRSDLGVNRRRVEALLRALQAA